MSVGARVFVFFIFFVLALSFVATTAVFIYEYRDASWFSLSTLYSHLFIFFPTFGLVALCAFYVPCVVFVDLYWKRHIRFGRLRFMFGFTVVAAASYFIAIELMKGEVPAIWEVAPEILKSDRGEPPGCGAEGKLCLRRPVLRAVDTVQAISRSRMGLSKFTRDCSPDPLIEVPAELLSKRFCFVTQTKLPAAACCMAQKRFTQALTEMASDPGNRSLTVQVHILMLPLKVFFLLLLLVVGLLLAFWRRKLEDFFKPQVKTIERGVLVGAFAMLFWPAANHAFLQSISVLYGSYSDSVYPVLAPGFSFMFGAWALLLLFFFFRRLEKDIEAAGKIAGVIASAIAVLKYDEIIDYFERFAGSGADFITLAIMFGIGVTALVTLFPRKNDTTRKTDWGDQCALDDKQQLPGLPRPPDRSD